MAAGVAELVDALDLGSSGASRGGSSPSVRTIKHWDWAGIRIGASGHRFLLMAPGFRGTEV